jgi:hypothetical protein
VLPISVISTISTILVLCCILLDRVCGNVLFATTAAWKEVVYANAQAELSGELPEPELRVEELRSVFESVWMDTHRLCPTLPADGYKFMDVDFDDRLLNEEKYSRILGWATRSEVLFEGTWTSAFVSESVSDEALNLHIGVLGQLRIARAPPGGWWRRTDGSKCVSKFRLEDILRHEIMHLVGIYTTVRKENDVAVAGAPYLGVCFPSDFDVCIKNTAGDRLIDARCVVQIPLEDGPFFVNGVELYQHEDTFLHGTSLSHSAHPGALLTPAVGACLPEGPREYTDVDGELFRAVGIECSALTSAEAFVETETSDAETSATERPSTVQNHNPEKSVEQSVLEIRDGQEIHPDYSLATRLALPHWLFLAIAATQVVV